MVEQERRGPAGDHSDAREAGCQAAKEVGHGSERSGRGRVGDDRRQRAVEVEDQQPSSRGDAFEAVEDGVGRELY